MTQENTPVFRVGGWALLYTFWIGVVRLLLLTFITYFVTSSSIRPAHFEEVNEALGNSLLNLMGLGALGFILVWHWLTPRTSTVLEELAPAQKLEKQFLPGLAHGALLALLTVTAFLISGHYRYLGFFIQLEEASLAIGSILFRITALILLVYCEEYFFRHRSMKLLVRHFSSERKPLRLQGAILISTGVSVAYLVLKLLQFDLGVMQSFTLFLVSMALCVRVLSGQDFARGAGFWAGILLTFHPLLSLPVLGNEFSGIMMVKHQVPAPETELFSITIRFLTGGAGGPLSSFAFQLLLGFDILRNIIRLEK